MGKAVFTVRESALTPTFEAASIHPGLDACAAVRQIADKPYLPAEAPSIPISGCSMRDACDCRYRHWDDRRQGERRVATDDRAGPQVTSERRSGNDRRQSSSGHDHT